jgi:hypothetical protein
VKVPRPQRGPVAAAVAVAAAALEEVLAASTTGTLGPAESPDASSTPTKSLFAVITWGGLGFIDTGNGNGGLPGGTLLLFDE